PSAASLASAGGFGSGGRLVDRPRIESLGRKHHLVARAVRHCRIGAVDEPCLDDAAPVATRPDALPEPEAAGIAELVGPARQALVLCRCVEAGQTVEL